MARPDRFDPWLVLVALFVLGLCIRFTLWPLPMPLSAPPPQLSDHPPYSLPAPVPGLSADPTARFSLPAVTAWPAGRPETTTALPSLAQFAG